MSTVAIVPALNEAGRVGSVVKALLSAGVRVLVVDDGSTDSTAEGAREAGAEVLSLPMNQGKGLAMLAGITHVKDDVILFMDADMKGVSPKHVRAIVDPVERGEADMVVGVSDYSHPTSRRVLLISGQRAVRRSYLLRMPAKAWRGYGIEVWINDTVARFGGKALVFTLDGVMPVLKWEKEGAAVGFAKMADMGAEVFKAMQDIVATYEEAPVPSTLQSKCSSTECVADALTESAAKAFQPYWTPEARQDVGKGLGEAVSTPLWGLLCVGCYVAGGPLLAGVAGLAWAAKAHVKSPRILNRSF